MIKKNSRKRLTVTISIILAIVILVALFLSVDQRLFLDNLININVVALVLTLLMFIPSLVLTTYRWQLMIADYRKIKFWQSMKMVLATYSINIITPSKLGDLGKAFFARSKRLNLKTGGSAVVLEKILDLLSLVVFAVLGVLVIKLSLESFWLFMGLAAFFITMLLFIMLANLNRDGFIVKATKFLMPIKRLQKILLSMWSYFNTIRKNKSRFVGIIVLSLGIWFFHLLQGFMFFWVINIKMNFFIALGLIPLGILVGMIPITISGMGTRDSAFIFLFSAYATPASLLLFGLLFSLKYVLAALLGLPCLSQLVRKQK